MTAFAAARPAMPGVRARNLLICLALLIICIREAAPMVRAMAQEGGDGTVAEEGSRAALGSSFTFQGRIEDAGLPLDGLIDLQFQLFSDAAGTVPASGTNSIGNASVTNGVFSELLDFGNAFNGEQRWISVSARPADSDGAYTLLGLQELTATPYAMYSAHTAFGQALNGTNSSYGLIVAQGGSGTALSVTNTGTGHAISTISVAPATKALDATNLAGTAIRGTGKGLGIEGYGDTGVAGYSTTPGYGASYGVNESGYGVVGDSLSGLYAGVLGRNPSGAGVKGTGINGVVGEGHNGVLGTATTRGNGGTYGISYAGSDCALTSNATKCYGAIGFSGAPNGAGVGVYGNGTWAGLYGVAGTGGAWAAVMEGKTYFGGTLDGPAGQLTAVHIQPDLDNFRLLGWGNRAWQNVVSYDFDTPSDARLKTNVNNIEKGLAAVMAMRPVSYELIATPGPVHLGLIAQEVQPIVPEVVDGSTEGEDRLSLNYSELIPVLIKAIQELQAEVEALKAGQ